MLTMAAVPTEIQPGVFWWTVEHPRIKQPVSSYFIAGSGTLIDPMIPPEGLAWFGSDVTGIPQRIVLTNRHHLRDSEAFDNEFGCSVHCNQAGLHEYANGPDVDGFFIGDEVAPGVVARQMNSICPDDTVLQIDAEPGLLAFADALIHMGGEVTFVPDFLMDDPPSVKRGIVAAAIRLAALDFDGLLFAHGDPIREGGKAALQEFVERNR
jgi:hypothetical protein